MIKLTKVSQIEVSEHGHIHVRIAKQIADGGAVLSSEYHRTSIECGGDVAEQMATINAHLEKMGWPPVDGSQIDRVSAIASADWTPARRAAWKEFQVVEKEAVTGTKTHRL